MNKIKKYLKHWYVYLISIAVAVVGSIYWCNFINRPKGRETITVFVATYDQNTSKLYNFLSANSPSYIREINITAISPKSPDFNYFLVNYGLGKADIFILHQSYVYEELATKQFASMKQEVLNEYFTYETETYNRGVLLHEKGEDNNDIIQYTSSKYEDENFYAFYRKNSDHIGKLNKSSSDTALLYTKALLEHGKE